MVENPPVLNQKNIEYAFSVLMNTTYSPLLNKIKNEYLYWDKVKYLTPKNIEKDTFWQAIKIQRSFNAKHIQFGRYNFHFTITEKMQAFLHEFDMNLGGSLGTQNIIPERDKTFYLINSIMEEAIASSQMEGASTTRKVAKEMLRKQAKPKDKSQLMIANNYATIRYLVENRQKEFSIENLLDIHRSIANKTLDSPEDEGKLRTDNTVMVMDGITGEIAHTPPSQTEVPNLLVQLCKFANEDNAENFIHPIVKGIIIHFMLAFIHPFVDGNGRTARSLVYWYLIKKGYWLTEYLSISRIIYRNKIQYEKSFLYTEQDENDLSYFIQFNLETMKKAFEELKSYLQRKIAERDGVLLFKEIEGINERQAHILKILAEKPNTIFTTKEIVTRFNITSKTARTDLAALVSLGYMQEVGLNKRTVGYVRSERFEKIMKSNSKT